MIKVFYLEPTDKSKLFLRRYADGPCPLISGDYSYHNAMIFIGEEPCKDSIGDDHPHEDLRWLIVCNCGYLFKENDSWQLFSKLLYKRHDTQEEMTTEEAPIGACWEAPWRTEKKTFPAFGIGDDGRCLYIKTPGGEWCPDERASNCTMPYDYIHKCWVRHGSPEDGTLHIDKNGFTCAAGAGSIIAGSYHGFLHNGHLVSC